jgi:hypothetical protein
MPGGRWMRKEGKRRSADKGKRRQQEKNGKVQLKVPDSTAAEADNRLILYILARLLGSVAVQYHSALQELFQTSVPCRPGCCEPECMCGVLLHEPRAQQKRLLYTP